MKLRVLVLHVLRCPLCILEYRVLANGCSENAQIRTNSMSSKLSGSENDAIYGKPHLGLARLLLVS